MKKVFVLLVILAAVGSTSWGAEGDGGYAGAFLQVPLGARPTAMGGAYIGLSDDVSGVMYNPAGLAGIPYREFGSSYRIMTLDRKLGFLSVVFPIQGMATLGVQWIYAGSGTVAERDRDGALVGRDFSHNSHQFGLTFAKRFESWFGAGVSISYLLSKVPQITSNAVGFDFGAMFHVNELIDRERRDKFFAQDVRVGLVVRNITKQFRWNSEKYVMTYTTDGVGFEQTDKFPIEVGFGGSAKFLNRKLILAADALKNEKQSVKVAFGGEYQLRNELALRTGYSVYGLSAGAGFQFDINPKQTLGIDYAFSTGRADEGSEHLFSIGLRF